MADQQPQKNGLELVKEELPTIEKILALSARPGTDLSTVAQNELMYLEAITQSKPEILKCTPLSLLLAVKGVMQKNLSLDPEAGLVYVMTRSVNTAPKGQPANWVSVVEMKATANGLISTHRQNGRILDLTNPSVKKNDQGRVIGVSVSILKPSFPTPRWELYEFDESDFLRWRRASHNERSRGKADANAKTLNYANPNYTNFYDGIDPEFARAKCIKHALKKLGNNPQEAAIRVYDVPKQRVVDPEIEADDYHDFTEGDNIAPHVEVSSTTHEDQQDSEFPNANDL